jgi:hypothetical protein
VHNAFPYEAPHIVRKNLRGETRPAVARARNNLAHAGIAPGVELGDTRGTTGSFFSIVPWLGVLCVGPIFLSDRAKGRWDKSLGRNL